MKKFKKMKNFDKMQLFKQIFYQPKPKYTNFLFFIMKEDHFYLFFVKIFFAGFMGSVPEWSKVLIS